MGLPAAEPNNSVVNFLDDTLVVELMLFFVEKKNLNEGGWGGSGNSQSSLLIEQKTLKCSK